MSNAKANQGKKKVKKLNLKDLKDIKGGRLTDDKQKDKSKTKEKRD